MPCEEWGELLDVMRSNRAASWIGAWSALAAVLISAVAILLALLL